MSHVMRVCTPHARLSKYISNGDTACVKTLKCKTEAELQIMKLIKGNWGKKKYGPEKNT